MLIVIALNFVALKFAGLPILIDYGISYKLYTPKVVFSKSHFLAPSAPPRNFMGMVRDHQSITFTWHEVPRDDWNSPSIEYLLNCCDNGITCKHRNEYLIRCCNVTEVTCLNRAISGGHTNFTLNGLKPFTLYNCSILAFNNQGQGPSAWVELVTTKQGNMIKFRYKSYLSGFTGGPPLLALTKGVQGGTNFLIKSSFAFGKAMDDSSYKRNFDVGKKNEIHYHS